MNKRTTIWTWLGAIALIFAVLPFLYLLLAPKLDGNARTAAAQMCDEIQVGSTIGAVSGIAKRHNVKINTLPNDMRGNVRYQAMFSGFLANGFICEIVITDNRVVSKFTDETTW